MLSLNSSRFSFSSQEVECDVPPTSISRFSALAAALVIGLLIGFAVAIFAAPYIQGIGKPAVAKSEFAEPPKPGEQVVIVHGFDAEYPPFTFVDENGKAKGFDVDVMDWIANKYGWKVIHKPWDWSTIVTALEKGEIDVIASGMTITPERASRRIWFSIPYYSYIHEIVVRADDDRTLDQLLNSGEYVAVQIGSTAEKWADKLLAKGYKFKKLGLQSYVEALDALLKGRASAYITDSAFLDPYLAKHPDLKTKIKVLTTLGAPETYGIATRPGDVWLREKINEALYELMNSPKWNELLQKWGLSG